MRRLIRDLAQPHLRLPDHLVDTKAEQLTWDREAAHDVIAGMAALAAVRSSGAKTAATSQP